VRPKPEHQRLAQQILNREIQAGLKDDGDFGRESVKAARKWFTPWPFRGGPTAERYVAAILQREASKRGIQAGAYDAFWGPQTQDAAYRMLGAEHVGWRPDEARASDVAPRPPALACWTPSDARMISSYGQPGTSQVVVDLPYPMRLDWEPGTMVRRASVHRIVAESLLGALEEIRDGYGPEEMRRLGIDRFGGILNVRKKRGGSTWSAHAWGVAIDLYPSANALAWKKGRAAFARAEYEAMRLAFARAGWMSLGQCYDFDWMHWQRNP
jgi:hypothetical protein